MKKKINYKLLNWSIKEELLFWGGILLMIVTLLLLSYSSSHAETKFQKAYKYVISHEGNYSNHPKDKGGETYRGIARKFNKDWYGWRYIDKTKNKQWNQEIPEANFWAQDYYLTLWVRENFEAIKDPDLAVYLFDFRISGPYTIKEIKKALNDYNTIPINRKMDNQTIDAINAVNGKKFIKYVERKRLAYFDRIVSKHPNQKVFLSGWRKRAKIKQ